MRYWWVNQNQTFQHEVQGGFLWSPKTNKGGGRNPFYDNMLRARPGDLVLSFSDTLIKAVGTVEAPAESATKPAFGKIGDQWDDEGWYVRVEFQRADTPVRPKDSSTSSGPSSRPNMRRSRTTEMAIKVSI